jgi:hypothetical protein
MYAEFVSPGLLRLVDVVSGLLRKGCCDTTCLSKTFSRMRYVQYWSFSYTCTVGVMEGVSVLYVWGEHMYEVIWRTRWGSAADAHEWDDHNIQAFAYLRSRMAWDAWVFLPSWLKRNMPTTCSGTGHARYHMTNGLLLKRRGCTMDRG